MLRSIPDNLYNLVLEGFKFFEAGWKGKAPDSQTVYDLTMANSIIFVEKSTLK